MNIDYDKLRFFCNTKQKHLVRQLPVTPIRKNGRVCWFLDRGSSVLGVAHLDHVQPLSAMTSGEVQIPSGLLWFNPRLDDRLGAFTLMETLPALGIEIDVLLTTDEESGASTADVFRPTKKYNWIVGFDRKGEDVVLYRYQENDMWLSKQQASEPWVDALEKAGFKIGFGTNSDITNMESLGCKAANIGIGYHNEHQLLSFFSIREYRMQMDKYKAFHDANAAIHYPHAPAPVKTFSDYSSKYDYYSNRIAGVDREPIGHRKNWNQDRLPVISPEIRCELCFNSAPDGHCIMCGHNNTPKPSVKLLHKNSQSRWYRQGKRSQLPF